MNDRDRKLEKKALKRKRYLLNKKLRDDEAVALGKVISRAPLVVEQSTRSGICSYCCKCCLVEDEDVFPKILWDNSLNKTLIVDACRACNESFQEIDKYMFARLGIRGNSPDAIAKLVRILARPEEAKFKKQLQKEASVVELYHGMIALNRKTLAVDVNSNAVEDFATRIFKGIFRKHTSRPYQGGLPLVWMDYVKAEYGIVRVNEPLFHAHKGSVMQFILETLQSVKPQLIPVRDGKIASYLFEQKQVDNCTVSTVVFLIYRVPFLVIGIELSDC